jgi:type IV pilus assembly protein PilV
MSAVRNPSPRRSPVCGFTLFEVLIAFFILSVGLVGVVSLQAISKASQHQAIQRTRAVALADEMLEMVRGNPRGVPVYAAQAGVSALGAGDLGAPATDCLTTPCDPNAMAVYDLWLWEQSLQGADVTSASGSSGAGLLVPRGCIRFQPDTANGKTRTGTMDIVVQWRGLQELTDPVGGGFVCGDDLPEAERDFRRQVVLSTYILDEMEL